MPIRPRCGWKYVRNQGFLLRDTRVAAGDRKRAARRYSPKNKRDGASNAWHKPKFYWYLSEKPANHQGPALLRESRIFG